MISMEQSLEHLPRVYLKPQSIPKIRSGKQPNSFDIEQVDVDSNEDYVALVAPDGHLVGIARKVTSEPLSFEIERII